MCGIAGILPGPDGGPLGTGREVEGLCRAMATSLAHRGPDGEGVLRFPRAAFAHRRLAILDLEHGHQPMTTPDGRLAVVFNGEIYNHKELRARLEAKGRRFRTRCDTEVLLHGYAEWGVRLPEFCRGMFAFAVHDLESGETLLARDPLGKKPLYLYEAGGRRGFASELRAFHAVSWLPGTLDPGALRELAALRYVSRGRTVWKEVRSLLPGSLALVRQDGALEERRYWRPPFDGSGNPEGLDFEEAAGRLRDLTDAAVERRLEAEVPLGAFLSGGIDSAAVVASMVEAARGAGGGVTAVTVGFAEGDHDERRAARGLAARLGIDLHEECCRPGSEGELEALAELLDDPLLDSSCWPTLLVSRAARRHVTVALSGDGGDESFGGYRRYRFDRLERTWRRRLPRRVWAFLARACPKADFLPRPLRAKRSLANLALDPAEAYFRSVSSLLPEEVDALFEPEAAGDADPYEGFREIWEDGLAEDPDNRLLEFDLRTWLPGDILAKVDRCSMAASLELRCPFLDPEIVGFAAGLPASWKFDSREGKKLPKEAFEPRLGRAWMRRPKRGFSIPLKAWLRGPLAGRVLEACRGEFAARFLRRKTLDLWRRQHARGVRDRSEGLWAVLMLHLWWERWGRG